MLLSCFIGKELERGPDAVGRLLFGDPATFGADADGGEPKTGGGGAGYIAAGAFGTAAVHSRAIQHQACAMVGLLPEIVEAAMLHVFYEGAIGRRHRRYCVPIWYRAGRINGSRRNGQEHTEKDCCGATEHKVSWAALLLTPVHEMGA